MDIRPIDANALLEKIRLREGPVLGQREVFLVEGEHTLTLNDLRNVIYLDAVAHGLWEGKNMTLDAAILVLQEAREMFDACDFSETVTEAFEEELADVIITSFSAAGKLGIDIDAAIRRKMEINKGRPWKHGKSNE